MTTIDEQIASVTYHGHTMLSKDYCDSILASLEELKRILAVQVPEQLEFTRADDFLPTTYVVRRTDYDTLRDLLKRESARADSYWENEAKRYAGNADYWRERAEAAQAKLIEAEKRSQRSLLEMCEVIEEKDALQAKLAAIEKPMEYATTFEREAMREKLDKQPTKIFGPNLEGTLNAAGFYRKKEWVGLTDDEIEHLRNDQPWWMVRDIEAKLKEKNGG